MSLFRYSGAIPHILLFQMITKVILVLIVGILSSFIDNLGSWSGIGVITNLDLPFLFRSFPGLCILFLVFLVVCVYTIFDIHVMILISDNVLHDKKQSIWMILKNAILAIRYMIYPETILVLLFVVLVAPLTFSFIGISLTESFYIPDFILSVVKVNPFFAIPYYIFLIIMAYLGFVYVFTFQFMLLRKVNIKEALYTSKCSMKKHWKDFLKRYGLFVIKFLLFMLRRLIFNERKMGIMSCITMIA